jgi:tRNA (guanine37-N1)-methyltransferase
MKFNVLTLMPDMVRGALDYGVVGSAFEKGLCFLETVNPRQFTTDIHQSVDDRPFGGGDGMLMMAEPLQKALDSVHPQGPIFYLSPQGYPFDDKLASEMSELKEMTLICGRYGGVDNRFLVRNQIQEISLGDFVMSGGEPAAIAIIDSIVRKRPGVLGHAASASEDSFAKGLLELPYFTRPQEWEQMSVPPILLSGDHKKIHEYKVYMSLVTTLMKRPDLIRSIRTDWMEALSFLTAMDKKNWQGTGFDREEVLLRVKDLSQ